jgi:hypothetical protein
MAENGAVQKLKMTPASIALAMAGGIELTSRPSCGQKAVSESNNPHTKNAPTAVSNFKPRADAEASRAAPGVDHTIEIGIL